LSQTTDAPARSRPRLEPLPVERAMVLPAKLRWKVVARYRAQGSFAEAAELLDAIEETVGESSVLVDERARLAFAQEEYETAIALLEERVNRAPTATAWIGLGRVYLEVGDLERAEEIAGSLLETSGELLTVDQFAAEVERAAGDSDAARRRYERILADRPDHLTSLLALAGLAIDEGDARQARTAFDRALVAIAESEYPAQLDTAATMAEALGLADQAIELRRRAIDAESERLRQLEQEIGRAIGEPFDGAELEPPTGPIASNVRRQERPAPVRTASTPTERPRLRAIPNAEDLEPAEPTPEPDIEAAFPGTLADLRRLFGHPAFRPGQAAVVANVLGRRDTLATMPTGAGKSLTFQLPAMRLEGTTLVMSPLIALMKDQVEGLPPAVQERTVLVNSTLSPDEMRRAIEGIAAGRFKLVYAAPERLRHHAFLRALRAAGVALVVIDEAHCISMWGHDFRPDYLAIPKALPELGDPPVLAITATATPAMAKQIEAGLGRELARVKVSLFRPNLFYEAYPCKNREDKVKRVVQICHEQRKQAAGTGIVYVSSRKDAEQIAGVLRDRGIGAVPYHAGLDPEIRARNQDQFMRDDNRARVVVATVAFGMGVDKANVRFIVHLSPPRSLEAYAQESGRAGRDGQPARCVLLYAPADQTNLKRNARRDLLEIDDLRPIYAGLKRAAVGRWAIVDPGTLLPPPEPGEDPDDAVDPRVAMGILEQAGLVYRHPDTPRERVLRPAWLADDPIVAPDAADRAAWERLKSWAGLDGAESGSVMLRTAEVCAALGLAPSDLERLLGLQNEYAVRDERRTVCLELLPAGEDAAARLRQVLERAKIEADRRIDQVMVYAAGRGCRHATLAAHLGERQAPCRTACDVCLKAAHEDVQTRQAGRSPAAVVLPPRRDPTITAADALAVIQAVRTLPFSMGKTGLTKLLVGSIESRVRDDRSNSFGVLEHLPKSRVDGLIDRMVEDGLLERDLNHEFKLISVTPLGESATLEMLEAYATPVRAARAAAPLGTRNPDGKTRSTEDVEFTAEDAALYERLAIWRRGQARDEGVSAYVVAPNDALRGVVLGRPRDPDELSRISGFGPARVEKYAEAILAIVAEAATEPA
jgi:ATP-dependent DNA helicase RecQ